MDLNFIPTFTQDGSIGLFNPEVDDIYHSSYGAYTEAFEKFIYPSGLQDFIKTHSAVRILDICYGMGYNTKAAIKTCLGVNLECSILIDSLEIDSNVFVFSFLSKQENFDFNILDYLDVQFLNNPKIIDSIYRILENDEFTDFLDTEISQIFILNKNEIYECSLKDKISPSLHNIYYRYISPRNIKINKAMPKSPKIAIAAHLEDARDALGKVEGNYDLIFLDAFTPKKLPTLWSVEFFLKLKELLKDGGNITTYSNSAAVRNGMIEAGFFVEKTLKGTIAFKNENLIKNPLDEKSLGLLGTRAGIPFYDKNLNATREEILQLREKMVSESHKQSSSSFLKNYTKNK